MFLLSLCLVFAELIVISARDDDEETFSQQITKLQEFLYIKPFLLRNYSEAEENFLFLFVHHRLFNICWFILRMFVLNERVYNMLCDS